MDETVLCLHENVSRNDKDQWICAQCGERFITHQSLSNARADYEELQNLVSGLLDAYDLPVEPARLLESQELNNAIINYQHEKLRGYMCRPALDPLRNTKSF